MSSERRRLLGIVAGIIELGGALVAMAGGLLHIFERPFSSAVV
jgi:hypothetical protein